MYTGSSGESGYWVLPFNRGSNQSLKGDGTALAWFSAFGRFTSYSAGSCPAGLPVPPLSLVLGSRDIDGVLLAGLAVVGAFMWRVAGLIRRSRRKREET